VESHPAVLAYVKNHNLGLDVPYRYGSIPRIYIPDFILLVDDGHDDPLNLIVEIKGYRGEDAIEKKNTMEAYWLPGVNAAAEFGRWAFAEFTDVYDIEEGLAESIEAHRGIALENETVDHEGFEGLDFKELLAAAPLEGIDLTRRRDLPRDIEL
jgi:type III restriction enzyme